MGALGAGVCARQNIVLSGGSTMFKDFNKRLQRDIKRYVDFRLKQAEELSKGRAKVHDAAAAPRPGPHAAHPRCVSVCAHTQPSPIDVNVISHRMQRYAVWFGGSMLAGTVRDESSVSVPVWVPLSPLTWSIHVCVCVCVRARVCG
jgi:actin-related protein